MKKVFKKVFLGLAVLLLVVVVLGYIFITSLSRVSTITIINMSNYPVKNLAINYDNRLSEKLEILKPYRAISRKLNIKGETGLSISYDFKENSVHSQGLYVETRGYHVYSFIDKNGKCTIKETIGLF